MGAEQRYTSLMDGVYRMMDDIESFLEPMWFKLHPLLHLITMYNIVVVSIVLIGMLAYVILVKKHSIVRRFRERDTYIFLVAGALLFIILNDHIIPIGDAVELNLGIEILPVMAKFLGPIPAVLFSIVQYSIRVLPFVDRLDSIVPVIASIVGGAIGALIFSLFLYKKRTKYLRCFVARLTVNVVCNVLLSPKLLEAAKMSESVAMGLSWTLLKNVFTVPIQAFVIYILLKAARKLKNRFLVK